MLIMQEREQSIKRLKEIYNQQSEKIEEMQRQLEFYKLMYRIQNKIIRGEMTK